MNLLLFGIIIGIIVEKIIFPIIDNLHELVDLWFEERKNTIVYNINTLNKQQDNSENSTTRVIGFRANDEGDD